MFAGIVIHQGLVVKARKARMGAMRRKRLMRTLCQLRWIDLLELSRRKRSQLYLREEGLRSQEEGSGKRKTFCSATFVRGVWESGDWSWLRMGWRRTLGSKCAALSARKRIRDVVTVVEVEVLELGYVSVLLALDSDCTHMTEMSRVGKYRCKQLFPRWTKDVSTFAPTTWHSRKHGVRYLEDRRFATGRVGGVHHPLSRDLYILNVVSSLAVPEVLEPVTSLARNFMDCQKFAVDSWVMVEPLLRQVSSFFHLRVANVCVVLTRPSRTRPKPNQSQVVKRWVKDGIISEGKGADHRNSSRYIALRWTSPPPRKKRKGGRTKERPSTSSGQSSTLIRPGKVLDRVCHSRAGGESF